MADVKICGLSEPTTLAAALDKGAAYIGFNFYEPSPRYVAPARAGELGARVRRALEVAQDLAQRPFQLLETLEIGDQIAVEIGLK